MQQPNIIEPLNFEEIFSRMKEELVRRDETFSALVESDPAMKILEVAAWRELLLRERINEAVKSNLFKFAIGEDLDNLAEFYGVERQKEEEDERFGKRVKAKIVGWSTGGSKEHYRYHALSADSRVKDALVESPIPGKVQISILSTQLSTTGMALEELLEIVKKQVTRDDIRVLTDTVTVIGCNIMEIDQLCFLNFLNLVLLQLLFIILYSCSIEKCIFGNKSPSLYRKEFMSNSYHYLGFMVNEYVL
ncbi:baseplate J/gp47 family protein [Wolbachia endosymbiont (group A) of Brachyopa scutellaris]|uniref:baseplate assembly protein n=1 Tax=Wolbachia endosymbiont (group A) of Brachyopa scutellaris TaxID=3066140 RepID=UPI00313332E2